MPTRTSSVHDMHPLHLVVLLLPLATLMPAIVHGQVECTAGNVSGGVGVSGTVVDSLGRPLSDARVRIEGTGVLTTTDHGGFFAFRNIPPGRWTLAASHTALEPFGYAGTFWRIETDCLDIRGMRVRLPSIRQLARARCPEFPIDANHAIAIGRVVDETGAMIPRASIRATWQPTTAEEGLGTESDEDGVFALCDVPTGIVVRVRETQGEASSEQVGLTFAEGQTVTSIEIPLRSATPRLARNSTPIPIDTGDEESAWLASKGFYRRADAALLHLTRDDIPVSDSIGLTQILTQAPRVAAQLSTKGYTDFWLLPADRVPNDERCQLDFYLNGSLVVYRKFGVVRETRLDDVLDPEVLTGVEVFEASNAPVTPPGDCGAVLLWIHRHRKEKDPALTGSIRVRITILPGQTPVPDVPVALEPGGLLGYTDESGTVRFDNVLAAVYRVEAHLPGWGSWIRDIALKAGTAAEILLEAERGRPSEPSDLNGAAAKIFLEAAR